MKHILIAKYRETATDGNPNAWKTQEFGDLVVKDEESFQVVLDFFKEKTSADLETTYEDVEDAILSEDKFIVKEEDWLVAYDVKLIYCLELNGVRFKLTPYKAYD